MTSFLYIVGIIIIVFAFKNFDKLEKKDDHTVRNILIAAAVVFGVAYHLDSEEEKERLHEIEQNAQPINDYYNNGSQIPFEGLNSSRRTCTSKSDGICYCKTTHRWLEEHEYTKCPNCGHGLAYHTD